MGFGSCEVLTERFQHSLLNETCGPERLIRTALFHGLEALGRYGDGDFLAELRNEKCLLLEIYLAAALAGRVEFGSAGAVGVPPAHLRAFTCYVAYACHMSRRILP